MKNWRWTYKRNGLGRAALSSAGCKVGYRGGAVVQTNHPDKGEADEISRLTLIFVKKGKT